MKWKNYLILAMLGVFFLGTKAETYTIKANVKDVPDGSLVVFIKNKEGYGADTLSTAKTLHGAFELKYQLPAYGFFGFIIIDKMPGKYLTLLVEPANFIITGVAANWPEVIVEGPDNDKAYRTFLKEDMKLEQQWKLAKKTKDETKIGVQYNLAQQSRWDFITTHPNSSYSAFLLLIINELNATQKQEAYNKLTTIVKQSEFGRQLKQHIELLKSAEVLKTGKLPSFAYATLKGDKLQANEIIIAKNKLTLIDFWASWCAPCREQNPELVQLYNKYHDKGLAILGISLDREAAPWKEAINKDKLPWYQVKDPIGNWDGESFTLFGLVDETGKHLPQSILVDQQGNVIARNLEIPALRRKVATLLGFPEMEPPTVDEQFLLDNKKREEVKETASGLQYEVLQQGTGDKPITGNKVKIHYTGTLINGKKFDSSIDRGEPVNAKLERFIPGWQEGLQLMPAGSKYKFYVPAALAYGDKGIAGKIPPGSTLIFEIELLEVEQ